MRSRTGAVLLAAKGTNLGCMLPRHYYIQIRDASGKWSGDVAAVESGIIRLSAPLPCDVSNDTYEYCTRLSPLLAYKSGSEGYWFLESPSLVGKLASTTADALVAFGWLLASALVNRSQFGFVCARSLLAQLWPTTAPQLGGGYVPSEFELALHDEGLIQVRGRGFLSFRVRCYRHNRHLNGAFTSWGNSLFSHS